MGFKTKNSRINATTNDLARLMVTPRRTINRINHNWACLRNVLSDVNINDIKTVQEFIGSTYMHKCLDIHIEQRLVDSDNYDNDDNIVEKFDSARKSEILFKEAKRKFIHAGHNHAYVRFNSEFGTIYLFMEIHDDDLVVSMIEFDSRSSMVLYYCDSTLTDEMIYCKFGSKLNSYLRLNANLEGKALRNKILLIQALIEFMKNPEMEYVQHSPFEMEIYHDLMKEAARNHDKDQYSMLVTFAELNGGHLRDMDINIMLVDHVDMIDMSEIHPLIDLNEKEWDYIDDYCKKHGYTNADSIDLNPFVSTSRYGNSFTINDDAGYPITIEFTYEDRILTFRIQEDCMSEYSDLTIIQEFTFGNVGKFKMSARDNILSVAKFIHTNSYDRLNNLPDSVDELIKHMSEISSDPNMALLAIWKIIMLLIVTYFRPERTRMVRVTEKPEKSDETESVIHTESTSHDDSDVIVSRILKTTRDAKEYINKHSHTGCHREYVMEKWLRVGHYRTYADGHTVWIGPTVCHRQLDLTDKEICIKL